MVKQSDIILKKLTLEGALMVREWRNDPQIKQHMDFQEHISEEQQLRWFKSLNSSQDRYYLIKHFKKGIGLIHLNQINRAGGHAYAGLFIGDANYQGTGAAYYASIKLLDEAFNELKLNVVFAKVKESNKEALAYNQSLGFVKVGLASKGFMKMQVTKEAYLLKKTALKGIL